ncbi:MAG: universal stress protein, partial [Myxococcales bacterium]|nr:universal stress protein [Myxococcales bacterium]
QGRTPRAALQNRAFTAEAVQVIERVQSVAQRYGVEFRPVVRAAKDLAQGISHAALEEKCSMIVMGWSSQDDHSPSKLLEDVVRHSRTDTIFLQLAEDKPPQRIGVALGGHDNLPLMVKVAGTLADQYKGSVVYLNVTPEYFEEPNLRHAREIHIEALRHHRTLVPYSTEVLRSDNPLEALVERSRELDLLVIGSTVRTSFDQSEVGTFASMVARQAHCSVVVVRKSLPHVLARALPL